jgi:hypothetical protein
LGLGGSPALDGVLARLDSVVGKLDNPAAVSGTVRMGVGEIVSLKLGAGLDRQTSFDDAPSGLPLT